MVITECRKNGKTWRIKNFQKWLIRHYGKRAWFLRDTGLSSFKYDYGVVLAPKTTRAPYAGDTWIPVSPRLRIRF